VSGFAAFLAQHPPFSELDEHELAELADGLQEVAFPQGRAVLVEDAAPAGAVYVICAGAMDLVHESQVVDVLEPGECFGHPSLLTGLAPAFTVRAHEDSTCLLIPYEKAERVFATPAGVRYIARTLRERLVRTGHTAHALPELATTKLRALVARPPLFAAPDSTIRQAAAQMAEQHYSAVLAETPDGLAIATDSDLVERVLAAGRSADEPLIDALRTPVLTAHAEQPAAEALLDLLDDGHGALAVTEHGRVIGVLTVADIAGGEHSPFALRTAISHAPDEDTLVDVMRTGMPRLLVSLLSAGLEPVDVTRALAVQSDAATWRLIDFALERHGPAPVSWAWLGLGSVARRELTLASDQDNALAYSDEGGAEADRYFAAMASDVNDGLARAGMGEDNAAVLARNPAWRMSLSRWREEFEACLEHPDRSHLVRAAVGFDFRHVSGGLDVVPPLVDVVRHARDYPDFLRRLARTAVDWPVPLKRRDRFDTDHDGRINIKTGGALPIANIARFYAITAGITISSTFDRLVAVEEAGALDRDTAVGLREAFQLVSRVRLEHHADCIATGVEIDNLVAPDRLTPLRRLGLRDALKAVADAQKHLSVYAPMSM
jgi:CBS domain-containing protein